MEEDGKTLERKEAIKTKTGFVLTSKDGQMWQIDYPVDEGIYRRYGNGRAERIAMFFLLLNMGHSLKEADRIAFEETKTK